MEMRKGRLASLMTEMGIETETAAEVPGNLQIASIGATGRSLPAKLNDWFMEKLCDIPLFQEAVKTKNARLIYLLANQALVGTREQGGNNRGPIVELLQKTIGGANKEAWCMSAQQACIEFAEEVTGVVSPIAVSEHCMTVWNKTPKSARVKKMPAAGAVVIWQHHKGGKPTTNGHTGAVESTDGVTMFTYEGNTESGLDSKGNVNREGGGFYRNKRGFKGNGSMKVVGFLIPFPAA